MGSVLIFPLDGFWEEIPLYSQPGCHLFINSCRRLLKLNLKEQHPRWLLCCPHGQRIPPLGWLLMRTDKIRCSFRAVFLWTFARRADSRIPKPWRIYSPSSLNFPFRENIEPRLRPLRRSFSINNFQKAILSSLASTFIFSSSFDSAFASGDSALLCFRNDIYVA